MIVRTEDAEGRDLDPFWVTLTGGGLAAFIVVVALVIGFAFKGRLVRNASSSSVREGLFPAPHPGGEIVGQLARLHAHEDEALNAYARTDERHAQVPIDRALAIVAEKHLLGKPAAAKGARDAR